jgi:hypothetical protein
VKYLKGLGGAFALVDTTRKILRRLLRRLCHQASIIEWCTTPSWLANDRAEDYRTVARAPPFQLASEYLLIGSCTAFGIISAVSALGTTVTRDRRRPLTRFERYLRLVDALANRQDDTGHLKELSDSFGHDVLNLATLAGRLLWSEGVTSDMSRGYYLLEAAVDTEAYFIMLQTACDIMADVVSTLGGVARKTPFESFHRLNQWALVHPERVKDGFKFLATRLLWFEQVNAVRTKLVHRGGDIWIYTDRVHFEWDVSMPGEKVSRGRHLLSTIQFLTRCMLEFSNILAEVVLPRQELQKCPQKTVISGIYVPALFHLLEEYRRPTRRDRLPLTARCLSACGGYAEATLLGYPNGFWWRFLRSLSERIGAGPSQAYAYVNTAGTVHDCKFVYQMGGKNFGVVTCEDVYMNRKWLTGARKSIEECLVQHKLSGAVLVGRIVHGELSGGFLRKKTAIVVNPDPLVASLEAFKHLSNALTARRITSKGESP